MLGMECVLLLKRGGREAVVASTLRNERSDILLAYPLFKGEEMNSRVAFLGGPTCCRLSNQPVVAKGCALSLLSPPPFFLSLDFISLLLSCHR